MEVLLLKKDNIRFLALTIIKILLTQLALARAHYHFTAKNNQKLLLKETESFFENVQWKPDCTIKDKPVHGRKETRNI